MTWRKNTPHVMRAKGGHLQEATVRSNHTSWSRVGTDYTTAIAHASLAETLIKLNTGLVSIISTFLSHQSGKNHLDLDYKSLTDLSDVSRKEALHSMTQLYRRLSQSQLRLYNIDLPTCQRCGDCMHVDCSEKSKSRRKEKRKHASSRQKINGPVVTRMPIKSSSQSQLVVMRPKNKRKSSSSSSNSSAVKLGSSPTCASPLASPLPKYVPVDPLEMQATTITKSPVGAWPESERLRVDSFDDPRPTTWLDTYTSAAVEYDHYPIPELPVFTPTPRKKATSSSQRNQASSPPPSVPPTVKRRLGKQTPSAAYTFASDSTRLGEIPQHNWTNPWDYEEAERLNTEATVNEYAREVASTEKPSRKKGLFGFLRRGSAAGVAA